MKINVKFYFSKFIPKIFEEVRFEEIKDLSKLCAWILPHEIFLYGSRNDKSLNEKLHESL